MNAQENQFRQFQIPNSNTIDVALTNNSHNQNHRHETLVYNERLGLDEAAADIERRQPEVDFNENQTEAAAIYNETMSEIENTANIVMDLREKFCNDDGTVNGVKVTGNV